MVQPRTEVSRCAASLKVGRLSCYKGHRDMVGKAATLWPPDRWSQIAQTLPRPKLSKIRKSRQANHEKILSPLRGAPHSEASVRRASPKFSTATAMGSGRRTAGQVAGSKPT